MTPALVVGDLVTYLDSPGIGTVGEVGNSCVRVDFFNSAAEPVARSTWVPAAECAAVVLGPGDPV